MVSKRALPSALNVNLVPFRITQPLPWTSEFKVKILERSFESECFDKKVETTV